MSWSSAWPAVGSTNYATETAAAISEIRAAADAILAGTAGHEAGNALKLGGALANLFWDDSNCPATLSAALNQKFKSGFTLKLGMVTPSSGQINVTFPLAFPGACIFAVAVPTCGISDFATRTAPIYTLTAAGLTAFCAKNGAASVDPHYWMALGY